MTILIAFLLNINSVYAKPLKVVTTIPDLAEVVSFIGQNTVEASSLLTGSEDAHFLEATPYFIAQVAKADIFCQVGLELEIGWAPKVIQKSSNKNIQPGSNGFCDASQYVDVLDKPQSTTDRSMGDVHKNGNPHYNLSPKALIQVSKKIAEVLTLNNPEKAELYKKQQAIFTEKMTSLVSKIKSKINSKQIHVIQYHKEFNYFFHLYNIQEFTSIESTPGVPPSTAELVTIALKAKNNNVGLAIGSHYSPEKHLKKFSEISKIPYKKLPTLVNTNNENFNTIEKLQIYITEQILNNTYKEKL